jgi:hypothetical protein
VKVFGYPDIKVKEEKVAKKSGANKKKKKPVAAKETRDHQNSISSSYDSERCVGGAGVSQEFNVVTK